MSCIFGFTFTSFTFSSFVLKYSTSWPASLILYHLNSADFRVWPVVTALYRYGLEESISLVNRNGVWIRVPVSLPVLLSVGMYRLCSWATTSMLPSRS
ncbi:Uncharacterised protein [Enterobacter hormaechei]|nr:Uncharacterised protein [Enterobacter hormaechei]